jgi:hypothetical protein
LTGVKGCSPYCNIGKYRATLPQQLKIEVMIVSHQHKIIFLKPRKVAGTSFEIALSKFLSESDVITPISRDDEAIRRGLGFLGPRNFNFELVKLFIKNKNEEVELWGYDIPLKFYNHISAADAKRRLGSSIWRDYKKISLVRNPWERAISAFFWKNTKRTRRPDLKNFTPYFEKNHYLLETGYAAYMIGGENVVDYFIRYENFEEDILKFETQMPAFSGLWDTFKDINAKSDTRDRSHSRQDIFAANPRVNAMIEKYNAWEIEKFGYCL